MDPYLEDARIGSGVPSRLLVYFADQLPPKLGSRYLANVEERVFVEGPNREVIPDVWIERPPQGRPEDAVVAVADADEAALVQAPSLEAIRGGGISPVARRVNG